MTTPRGATIAAAESVTLASVVVDVAPYARGHD
jgi:hypothetical protein